MRLIRFPQASQPEPSEVFVRAMPESFEITESYVYESNISKNSYIQTAEEPTGRIELVVPFDGHRYFSLQACRDIEQQAGTVFSRDAKIGHLALTEFRRTDLQAILNLSDRCGSVPLVIPLSGSGLDSPEQLTDDRHACILSFDYRPEAPEVIPVDIELSLWDEEPFEMPNPENLDNGHNRVGSLTIGQESFLRSLRIQCTARVSLPPTFLPEGAQPTIARMSLSWPSLTSLRGLSLSIGRDQSRRNLPIRYDPIKGCLEWSQVPFRKLPKVAGTLSQQFESEPMALEIHHPGELYQQAFLEGVMDVELPGRLLSGLKTSLFDSLGQRAATVEPKVTTKLTVRYKLVLSEAFARRRLSPYQHLHFAEVVPDAMRIADIRHALKDRGFEVHDLGVATESEVQHVFCAERPDAQDALRLLVLVSGALRETERTQQDGTRVFKSTVESGYLRVFVRGELRSNSRRLIQEMNAFQAALRGRFPRLRAKC